MNDYDFYVTVKHVERELDMLGMELSGDAGMSSQMLAVRVKSEADYTVLPPYTRSTVLMRGSLREIECWLVGYKRAMHYVNILGLNVKKAEDKYASKIVAQKMGMKV